MMRFASLSVGVLVTQITSILVAAEFDVCSNAVSIYTEHQNDPLADTSAVKFNAALGLESNLVDDYSAWCNLLGCPQFNSNAATWCATDGGSVCVNQCAALQDGTHPANGIDNVCTRHGIPNCEHSMMRELSQVPKWECGTSLKPRVEGVLHISVLSCEASTAAMNLAWEFSPDVIYGNEGKDDQYVVGVKDLKCWGGDDESPSFLTVYSNSERTGAGNPEYPCAQIARHITKATGRMVECADWWGPNSILKLKDPADCSHVTYELDKISMSGTLPPAAISTSPSRSPTLAPISKSTSPTQVPITGKPTASHMCASPGSNCFIKQKVKGCDDESCMNVICESKAKCCDKKWNKKCAITAIEKCNMCSCSENVDGIFFLKIKKGEVKTKTCEWLEIQKKKLIKKLCKKFSNSGNIKAARFVCPVTCNLCAK